MNCLQNPPKLLINGLLYSDRDMPVHVRLEQRIVWNLLLVLSKGGWDVNVVDDGEEIINVNSAKAAMELIFNLDDCFVAFKKKDRKAWVRLVLGNELEVISDFSTTNGFQQIVDDFKPEVYA